MSHISTLLSEGTGVGVGGWSRRHNSAGDHISSLLIAAPPGVFKQTLLKVGVLYVVGGF